MSDILTVMKKQLDIEIKSAEQKLTSNNLDSIYKLASSIMYLQRLNIAKTAEEPEYSDGIFEKNIDILYEKYMDAKRKYRQSDSEPNKFAMMESLRRLMAELYDMIGSMLKDCECAEEKREIQVNIRKLSEL